MKDRHIRELLEIQLEHDTRIGRLGEALGSQCEIWEIFPLNLLNIVADLLGVPADNYLELGIDIDERMEKGEYPKEYYCRDWVGDRWLECMEQDDPINMFIKTMKGDTEAYIKVNE